MDSSKQLTLQIGLRDEATFENFYPGQNQAAIEAIKAQVVGNGDMCCYLWGPSGSGLTHLLQAACHLSELTSSTSFYLDLQECAHYAPDMLDGLEQFDLVCLDNIDQLQGAPAWEEGLFHLFNRLRDGGHHLLVSAKTSPLHINIRLADLKSRLAWGLACQCQALNDEQKIKALQQRAKNRGLVLTDAVAAYVIRHCSRDMHQLFDILNDLDKASLLYKKRLSIPLVKRVLMRRGFQAERNICHSPT